MERTRIAASSIKPQLYNIIIMSEIENSRAVLAVNNINNLRSDNK